MDKDVHPLVQLAHRAVAAYILERRTLPARESELTPEMSDRAGHFRPSMNSVNCAAALAPFYRSVRMSRKKSSKTQSLPQRAIRVFRRSGPTKLQDLEISVDVLSEPEPIESPTDLDPTIYGVIVTDLDNFRRGLLLPALEQVKTTEQQLAIARQKAFIGPDEPVKTLSVSVKRYH